MTAGQKENVTGLWLWFWIDEGIRLQRPLRSTQARIDSRPLFGRNRVYCFRASASALPACALADPNTS